MADRQENKKTVVVVDDEPIIRMDLGQMLEELNYEVVAEGADGFDAVELCRKKNPDVVLLDLEMPVFDGMTAAETIINENLAGCVVICTAFADEDFLEQAGRIGSRSKREICGRRSRWRMRREDGLRNRSWRSVRRTEDWRRTV